MSDYGPGHEDDDGVLQAIERLDDDDEERKVIAFARYGQIPGGFDGVAARDDGGNRRDAPEDAGYAYNHYPAAEGWSDEDLVEETQDAEFGEGDGGYDEDGVDVECLGSNR